VNKSEKRRVPNRLAQADLWARGWVGVFNGRPLRLARQRKAQKSREKLEFLGIGSPPLAVFLFLQFRSLIWANFYPHNNQKKKKRRTKNNVWGV
jgi:hypothetical protein